MSLEAKFTRLIDCAPHVTCTGCHVEMTLRTLLPVGKTEDQFTAGYRCPKCGTDTERTFAVPTLTSTSKA
jgi:hypothetical protein